MNKRTADLFAQALDEAVPETWTTLSPVQLMRLRDKFAELIVRECAVRCDEYAASLVGDTEFGNAEKTTAYMLGDDIREHFGVEE